MLDVFIGSEALRGGLLTRGQLRWQYVAILPDIYALKHAQLTLRQRTVAAWLWTGRQGVVAGRAAAALHGAKWVDRTSPIELIWQNSRPPRGVIVRNERVDADEIVDMDGMLVTTPERTAADLARHLPRDAAVEHLDALANATGIVADGPSALLTRHRKARGVRTAPVALSVIDGGAQSPKETWLRLLLIDDGLPRPRTQIRVGDGFNNAYLDMGFDDPRVGLDYDGAVHQTDRRSYVRGIGRDELIAEQGWLDIHVVAEHSRAYILHRTRKALGLR